ncbi:hypothetical protein JXK06_03110 [Patescibacteria group bacterium]|nr:hypothetical protein [Patescibacteria group bacterium]
MNELMSKKLAIIMPATEKALLTGTIIFFKNKLLEKHDFNVDRDLFIAGPGHVHETNLKPYDKVMVIDPENKFLDTEMFLSENYYQRKKIHWYIKPATTKLKIFMLEAFSGQNNIHYCEKKRLLNFKKSSSEELKNEIIRLSRSLDFLENGKSNELAPRQFERIKKAVYMAKFKDKSRASSPILLNTTIKQLFFELIFKKEAPLIVDLIVDFQLLKEAEKKAKRTIVEHPILGKLKVVKPKKGSTVEIKNFFENGFQLGYQAVAVRLLAKDEYELCLKKHLAEEIADQIPAIKRINGCRFIVNKEFLIPEPAE